MNAHHDSDYRPPMGPSSLALKRAALVVAGVLIALAGVLFAGWMVLAFVVVAATGTGAGMSTMLSIGYAVAVIAVAICAALVWLSTRLGRRR